MKNKKLEISYQHYADNSQLSAADRHLLDKAMEAAKGAYAPYSHFRVGCAVLMENGEIVLGNNQENRALPSGLCAERTALFHIGAQGQAKQIRKIAIRAYSEKEDVSVNEPILPCGACRQVMLEYEQQAVRPIILFAQGKSGTILRLEGIQKTLMPFSFDMDF